MKLLTFAGNGGPRVGAAIREGVVDLTSILGALRPEVRAESTLALIESGIDVDTIAGGAIEELRAAGKLSAHIVADPRYLPPILRPSKILALALNYPSHIAEMNLSFHNEPIVFTKYASNLTAHEGDIELPPFPQKVDEEHELALVIGRECRHVLPSQAGDYIFGYTICNDVSARNRQDERHKMGQPYDYAKNFATFCPMGPWIVTRAELPDPHNLACEVRINGEVRRSGNTRDMIFAPEVVLAYCSDYTTLLPGDVISLGTFAGDKTLRAGDLVELEIEQIGVLRNRVVASRHAWPNFAADAPTGPLVKESGGAVRA